MLKAGERDNDRRHKARNSCEMRQSLGCDGARMLLSWTSAVEGVAPDPNGRCAIGSDPVGEIRCWTREAQFAEFCELSNRSRRVGASEAASGAPAEMERCLLTKHADGLRPNHILCHCREQGFRTVPLRPLPRGMARGALFSRILDAPRTWKATNLGCKLSRVATTPLVCLLQLPERDAAQRPRRTESCQAMPAPPVAPNTSPVR